MLNFLEELFLLALDDDRGVVKEYPNAELDYAMAGAALMELALANRIDTDPQSLFVVSTVPTGNTMLDNLLKKISAVPDPKPIQFWLESLVQLGPEIRQQVLAHLIAKKVLKQEKQRILWVFAVRRYPVVNDHEHKEVKARLREVILSSQIPDPRDLVLISLVQACHLFWELFSEDELERVQPRIAALAKMDLIGQSVARSIRQVQESIALVMRCNM